MKTLLLAPELFANKGGIQTCLKTYLRALGELAASEEGEVELIVLNDGPEAEEHLRALAVPRLMSAIFCGGNHRRMVAAVLEARKRVDRIVCGHLHLSPALWLAKNLSPSLRYFVITHGIEAWKRPTPLQRRALRSAERVLCVSGYTRGALASAMNIDRNKLAIVYNTLDPEFGRFPWKQPENFPLNPGGKVILTVARLEPGDRAKGVELLLEAMPAILEAVPNTRLVIVGSGRDQPRLKTVADMLELGNSVFFAGSVPDEDLPAYYEACDLFALPSEKEGFGLVFLEAMRFGKPCLGAAAGGATEVITARSGILVPPGDIEILASEAVRLLHNPPAPEEILADADRFSFPRFREQLAGVLRHSNFPPVPA